MSKSQGKLRISIHVLYKQKDVRNVLCFSIQKSTLIRIFHKEESVWVILTN